MPRPDGRSWRGFALAALAAFLFATMPVVARIVYARGGCDPIALLSVRFTLGALLLWALPRGRESLWPSRAEWPWLALAMAGLFITSAGYFLALRSVPATTAVLLIYTYPAFTALIARLWLGEPLGLHRLAALLLTFAGAACLVGWSLVSMRAVSWTGLSLACLAGLTYAAFGLSGQRLTRNRSAAWVNRWVVTGVALSYLVLRPPAASWYADQPLLLGGLYLGAVVTFLANTLYLAAIRLVGATRAGLYSTTEPFFATLLAWAILGERLTGGQAIGAVLVLAGVLGLEGLGERR